MGRVGFTMQLMKLKLQGPSLAGAPSKALAGTVAIPQKCPEVLKLIRESLWIYHLLESTYKHIILIHISPHLAATCSGRSPSSVRSQPSSLKLTAVISPYDRLL